MATNVKIMIVIVSGVFLFIMGMGIVVWFGNRANEQADAEAAANANTNQPTNTQRVPGVIY